MHRDCSTRRQKEDSPRVLIDGQPAYMLFAIYKIDGLVSVPGRSLNNRFVEFMGVDEMTRRAIVRINPQDRKVEWKRIKMDNLQVADMLGSGRPDWNAWQALLRSNAASSSWEAFSHPYFASWLPCQVSLADGFQQLHNKIGSTRVCNVFECETCIRLATLLFRPSSLLPLHIHASRLDTCLMKLDAMEYASQKFNLDEPGGGDLDEPEIRCRHDMLILNLSKVRELKWYLGIAYVFSKCLPALGRHDPTLPPGLEEVGSVSKDIASVIQSVNHSAKEDPSLQSPRLVLAGSEAISTMPPQLHQPVVEDYEHSDLPLAPDESDGIVADVLWATSVEQRIAASARHGYPNFDGTLGASTAEWIEDMTAVSSHDIWTDACQQHASEYGDKIVLLKFTRCGKRLKDALHSGQALEPVRAAAQASGQTCHLKTGASIFVYPNQHKSILSVIPDVELRPHHVIVSEAFLPMVYQDISKIPSKFKIRPSCLETVAIVGENNEESVCIVEKTFINSRPRQLREPDAVTQSTSELHNVLNARRRTVVCDTSGSNNSAGGSA